MTGLSATNALVSRQECGYSPSMNGEAIHIDSNGEPIHYRRDLAGRARRRPGAPDARRNRDKILRRASSFGEVARRRWHEVARRAGWGWRPCTGTSLDAASCSKPSKPIRGRLCWKRHVSLADAATGEALRKWLWRFFTFITTKARCRNRAPDPVRRQRGTFGEGRTRPSRRPARCWRRTAGGRVRDDITPSTARSVGRHRQDHGPADYVEPILQTALDGVLGRRT